MKISRVGVDLAKNVFQIHGADSHGKGITGTVTYLTATLL
jgi:hypothetical protein